MEGGRKIGRKSHDAPPPLAKRTVNRALYKNEFWLDFSKSLYKEFATFVQSQPSLVRTSTPHFVGLSHSRKAQI
jgi:hypothetical protein